MFNTIDEVYSYLYTQKKLSKRENLDRIKYCKDKLGININYKIIHVAGTNGKGSTATMIKSLLMLKGIHVGLFCSPFVISFNERIQINDRYISNAEIMHYMNILYEFNENYKKEKNDVIPFFELTLLMALMYFDDRKIDFAVIECGLGGLLDSTNFLNTDLSIITNVGFDHMAQLGNTLESIANHKLGIVKDNMTCITAVDKILMPQFIEYAKAKNAKIINITNDVKNINVDNFTYFEYKNKKYKTNLLGEYQAYNASIAIEASKYFYNDLPDQLIDYALSNIFWPGRLEIVSNNPLIIIDGAHNIHAMNALVNTIRNNYKKKVNVIFSALVDKDIKGMINILDNITNKYYFTGIDDARKSNIEDFKNYTNIDNIIINDFKMAIDKAKEENKGEIILITGSLHFISEVRAYIKNNN